MSTSPTDDDGFEAVMAAVDDFVTVARMTTTELSATATVCVRTRIEAMRQLRMYRQRGIVEALAGEPSMSAALAEAKAALAALEQC